MVDSTIQHYLKDAIRNVDIKIFKAEITTQSNENITQYFTSRLEMGCAKTKGNSSVYDKLAAVRNLLNSTNMKDCKAEAAGPFPDGIAELKQEMDAGSSGNKSKDSTGGKQSVAEKNLGTTLSDATK
jgi:hypothetical protein